MIVVERLYFQVHIVLKTLFQHPRFLTIQHLLDGVLLTISLLIQQSLITPLIDLIMFHCQLFLKCLSSLLYIYYKICS